MTTTNPQIERIYVLPDRPMREAMRVMDEAALGIVLVTDAARSLLGTITDGDIRRAILGEQDLDVTAGKFIEQKHNAVYPKPISAPAGTDRRSLLRLMQEQTLHQLPLIDADGHVVDLVTLDDLIEPQSPPMSAVIMAGGLGTRLRPLTDTTPKPMLTLGGRPLLEHTLAKLRDAGIYHVSISTFFEAEKVVEYFRDGREFGVKLHYLSEEHPMGTAGALGLLEVPDEPLLVINGDILTNVDFCAMLKFHCDHGAMLTVSVRQYKFSVPYGVIECDGVRVRGVTEKPVYNSFVNAGIYLLEPSVFDHIPRSIPEDKRFDMTDLIGRLIEDGKVVVGFPIHEYWLDIGQSADYERAESDVRDGLASRLVEVATPGSSRG